MRLLALVSVSVAAVVVTSACGSSRAKSVSVHSPAHHYSVQQVEAAFADHGIQLQRVTVREKLLSARLPHTSRVERRRLIRQLRREYRGEVGLRGLAPHGLVRMTVMEGPFPLYADTVRKVVNGGLGGFAAIRHGNLFGLFDARDRAAVRSALAELH